MTAKSIEKPKKALSIKRGATVLAVGSVLAKLLGALYRIPLTNILGASGIGLYQLVFPVYALFMILSTIGIPMFACMLTLVTLSTVSAILVFSLAKYITLWQGNETAYKGFWIIAPSLVFVGAIAGFRGWFQGEMYMLPTR